MSKYGKFSINAIPPDNIMLVCDFCHFATFLGPETLECAIMVADKHNEKKCDVLVIEKTQEEKIAFRKDWDARVVEGEFGLTNSGEVKRNQPSS